MPSPEICQLLTTFKTGLETLPISLTSPDILALLLEALERPVPISLAALFVLSHELGHGTDFSHTLLNRGFGRIFLSLLNDCRPDVRWLTIGYVASFIRDSESAFLWTVDHSVTDLVVSQYWATIKCMSHPGSLALLENVGNCISGFSLYPRKLSVKLVNQVMELSVDAFGRRRECDCIIGELFSALLSLVEADVIEPAVLQQVGLLRHVLDIASDPHSRFLGQAFFLLGTCVTDASFDLNLNLPVLCAEFVATCDLAAALDGFCFFLSNALAVRSAPVADLVASGFFVECIGAAEGLPFTAQIEVALCLMFVLPLVPDQVLDRFLVPGIVAYLFGILENADDEVLPDVLVKFELFGMRVQLSRADVEFFDGRLAQFLNDCLERTQSDGVRAAAAILVQQLSQ
jgi:hypothetical protein